MAEPEEASAGTLVPDIMIVSPASWTDGEQDPKVKIYTKTGDDGITGLLGNRRVPKDDIRIEAYGTVDELNAVLGLARAQGLNPASDKLASQLQNELFVVGSALADPDPAGRYHNAIRHEQAARLEEIIDALESELKPLTTFILPEEASLRPSCTWHARFAAAPSGWSCGWHASPGETSPML